jgi:soluble lytic murein transglycosylase-like protein
MANYLDNLDEGQKRVADMIREQAQAQGVPVNLALSLAFAENGFRQYDQKGKVILSPKGAVGIMQVMPGTGKEYGFSRQDLTDPEKNVQAGVSVLKDFLSRSNGDSMMAAGMYNAGPNHSFFKTGKGDLPEETQNYIAKINGYGGFGEGEPAPNEPKQPVEVEPTPNEPTPEATVHAQEAADTGAETQKADVLTAAALGGTAGMAAGYVRKKATDIEDRIFREERARAAAVRKIAEEQARKIADEQAKEMAAKKLAEHKAKGSPPKAPGNLPAPEPGIVQEKPAPLKGAQKWVQSLGNEVPYKIASQAETMDKVSPKGGQTLINQDAAAMEKIRRLGEGRQVLTGEGMGQLMVPAEVVEEKARAAAAAEANAQRLAAIERDTNIAREARLAAQQSKSPLTVARSMLNQVAESPVGRFGTRAGQAMFKYAPVVGYGVAGASAMKSAEEIKQAMERNELINAILAAAQLTTTGASMIPPLAPFAVPADIGLGAYRMGREYMRQK